MKQEEMIEQINFPKTGYEPLIDFEAFRVAVLAFCEDTKLDHIKTMQRHEKTDEVFILVKGKASLLCAGKNEIPQKFIEVKLEEKKAYNVKKGVWHNHYLSEDALLVIVERSDTSDENSPIYELSKEEIFMLNQSVL